MKTGTDNRKQALMAGVLGVLALGACVYLYEELFGGGSTPASGPVPSVSAPAVSSGSGVAEQVPAGGTAKAVGTTSAALDPTLHMDAMLVSESVEYSGTGRNIFSASSVPVAPIPSPIAKARPQVAAVASPPPVPCPPNCPPPPPPPPIDLKFFGVATGANGARKAFLLHNDVVYTASAGDVVLRRYKVIAINPKTIDVEDLQNQNKQTLPLLVN